MAGAVGVTCCLATALLLGVLIGGPLVVWLLPGVGLALLVARTGSSRVGGASAAPTADRGPVSVPRPAPPSGPPGLPALPPLADAPPEIAKLWYQWYQVQLLRAIFADVRTAALWPLAVNGGDLARTGQELEKIDYLVRVASGRATDLDLTGSPWRPQAAASTPASVPQTGLEDHLWAIVEHTFPAEHDPHRPALAATLRNLLRRWNPGADDSADARNDVFSSSPPTPDSHNGVVAAGA